MKVIAWNVDRVLTADFSPHDECGYSAHRTAPQREAPACHLRRRKARATLSHSELRQSGGGGTVHYGRFLGGFTRTTSSPDRTHREVWSIGRSQRILRCPTGRCVCRSGSLLRSRRIRSLACPSRPARQRRKIDGGNVFEAPAAASIPCRRCFGSLWRPLRSRARSWATSVFRPRARSSRAYRLDGMPLLRFCQSFGCTVERSRSILVLTSRGRCHGNFKLITGTCVIA